MTQLTRAQIEAAVRPGDVILVHYVKKNVVAAGIQFFEEGKASHALCCLGGMDVVEADLGGIMRTSLDSYLRGHCRLTVKRLRPEPTDREVVAMRAYWLSRVGDPYDVAMILGMVPILVIRKLLHPLSPAFARWAARQLPNLMGSLTLNTCAELWVRGVRMAKRVLLTAYKPDNCTPETILRDPHLEIVQVWDSPVAATWDQ